MAWLIFFSAVVKTPQDSSFLSFAKVALSLPEISPFSDGNFSW